jgi:hypothetical protein
MSEIGTNSEEDSLVISCVRCLEMGWFATEDCTAQTASRRSELVYTCHDRELKLG